MVGAGLALVLAATAFRAWQLHGAWFFYDDFYFLQRALEGPLSWAYLVEPYNGHLMPAGAFLTWVNTQIDPMAFVWPAAETLGFFVLAGVAMLRLLVRLFGPRPGILVPLLMFLFSPMLIPATVWWAAAVNQGPMLAAIILALTSFVDYLRRPRTRSLAATFAWMTVGLLFVERTLLGFAILWLVALLYFTAGPLPARLRELWRRYRPAVVTQALFTTAYLGVYLPFALNFDAGSVTRRPLLGVLRDLVGVAFGTGAVGGPLEWRVSQVTQSEAHPSELMLTLSWAVVAGVVLAAATSRRHGLRAWLIPLTGLLASTMLISVSRAIYFGSEIARDYRFQTESALTVALALGLSFLSVPGARQSSEALPGAGWSVTTPSWALISSAVFLTLATISTSTYPMRSLTATSPERYYRNLEASLQDQPDVQLLNRTTPSWLWAPLAYPTNTYRYMFRILPEQPTIRTTVIDDASIVDDTGRVRPIRFDAARAQRTGAAADGCFGRASGGLRRWYLDGPVVGTDWYLRLRYDAPAGTDATITIGEKPVRVHLEAGEHTLITPAPGTYSTFAVQLEPDSSPVCLERLEIGSITPEA